MEVPLENYKRIMVSCILSQILNVEMKINGWVGFRLQTVTSANNFMKYQPPFQEYRNKAISGIQYITFGIVNKPYKFESHTSPALQYLQETILHNSQIKK